MYILQAHIHQSNIHDSQDMEIIYMFNKGNIFDTHTHNSTFKKEDSWVHGGWLALTAWDTEIGGTLEPWDLMPACVEVKSKTFKSHGSPSTMKGGLSDLVTSTFTWEKQETDRKGGGKMIYNKDI